MVGPHRPQLLSHGSLDKLLEAALTMDVEPSTFKVIQHSAAVGIMYLSTMAGTVSAKVRGSCWPLPPPPGEQPIPLSRFRREGPWGVSRERFSSGDGQMVRWGWAHGGR